MRTFTDPEEKRKYLTEEPIPRLILTMAVPSIISMLISSFYNMADTYFVGRVGTTATAAVGVIFPLMSIIQALGFTFGHGSGNYISRALGHGDVENARKMATTGFISALIAGAVFGVIGLIFLDGLVSILGATPTIAPYARDYARFILIGTPFMAASLVLNNQLRFQGSAFYGMIGMGAGAVLNIALDPLFIFVFHMGVSGAALATILSQIVSFFLLLRGCTRGGNIAISLKEFSPSLARYKEIARGGTPSLFRQGLGSVASICLNFAAGLYGDAAIAGMSIVTRVLMFANSAVIGLGQGFQPVCGFNYGARQYGRVRKAFWFTVCVGFCVLLVFSVAGIVFAPQIIAIFRKEDLEVVSIGALSLRLQCIAFPFSAYIVGANMMLQTIGKPVKASIVAAARSGIFFVPAILILPMFFGLLGVQMSQAVADVCSLILSIPLVVTTLAEMKRMEKVENPLFGDH
jgi:putative MATE family efflux protein